MALHGDEDRTEARVVEKYLCVVLKKGKGTSACKECHRHLPGGKKGKPKGDRTGGGDGGGRGGKADAAGGGRKATHDDTCLNCGGMGHLA